MYHNLMILIVCKEIFCIISLRGRLSFILTGAATKDVKPVRFVLPDTELGSVVEEECVDMGQDDVAWEMSRTVEGSQPCEQIRKRKAKGICIQRYQYICEESIRKEVVRYPIYKIYNLILPPSL